MKEEIQVVGIISEKSITGSMTFNEIEYIYLK